MDQIFEKKKQEKNTKKTTKSKYLIRKNTKEKKIWALLIWFVLNPSLNLSKYYYRMAHLGKQLSKREIEKNSNCTKRKRDI